MTRFLILSIFFIYTNCLAGDMHALIRRCAPRVHAQTMGAIVRHESGGNYLVIGDNGNWNLPKNKRVFRSFYPANRKEAVSIARNLIHAGHVIDIGLGQVNNRNLARLGATVDEAFDPCLNLQLAERILLENYQESVRKHGHGRAALLEALSRYNTGHPQKGFKNGYVRKIVQAGAQPLPKLHIKRPETIGRKGRKLHQSTPSGSDLTQAKNASGVVSGW